MAQSVANGSAASANGYGRTIEIRGWRRAMSSSPATHTTRRWRAASDTGTGALSPTRSQGATNTLGSPAITAISSTGSSGASRYTAPECACTSSMRAARAGESSGRPAGAGETRGACPYACQSVKATTSSLGHTKESGGPRFPGPDGSRAVGVSGGRGFPRHGAAPSGGRRPSAALCAHAA